MNKTIIKRLGNLLSVKALVTLTLTAVFACMAAAGSISQDFMTVYTVVIAFYFGLLFFYRPQGLSLVSEYADFPFPHIYFTNV